MNGCRSDTIKIVASYDGQRIKVVSAVLGDGSARSYLSQRRDIVVLILNKTNKVLREFNLPDPLELRVLEPPTIIAEPRVRPPVTRSGESTLRRKQTQFELFIPRLDGAKWLEFRAKDSKGQLLSRVDLAKVR